MGGLACAPAIRWLIDNESDLKARIGDYLFERNNFHEIPFAMPAPAEEMLKHRKNRDKYKLMFPQIVLKLRRIKNGNEIGVEVTCSDSDLEQIVKMARETELRKAIAKAPALI